MNINWDAVSSVLSGAGVLSAILFSGLNWNDKRLLSKKNNHQKFRPSILN